MKVFVSVDMEGATGVVHNDQLMPGKSDYARGRKLLTGDVATAVRAALSRDDVHQVLVCDGHGNMRNLLLEELPRNCQVVVGPASSKALCQSEGLDASFGAMMLVGYHARAGSRDAVLPHTWIGSLIHEVRVNGRVFGETAINAAIGGEFGVPVVFVAGDEAVCREAKTRAPFVVAGPVEFAIAFHQVAQADRAAKRPGVERTGDREVTLRRATYLEAVRDAWQTAEWTAGEHPEWLA
jgi:D-amino peptidase